ncbi:hypothetical protein NPA11_00480 [Mycoplasma sp. 1578d]|uniref:hypothetical protein n=1 Tax=Mycoplasma sp. 1578d TaxID=2967299 RepID=UPI00211CB0D1|nr:hypothetical protein [Mycoplasma sp. 1578d]UUM19904.1 hypothetical protein NPA11_00480 [Mycoplasma sp. 1578d]
MKLNKFYLTSLLSLTPLTLISCSTTQQTTSPKPNTETEKDKNKETKVEAPKNNSGDNPMPKNETTPGNNTTNNNNIDNDSENTDKNKTSSAPTAPKNEINNQNKTQEPLTPAQENHKYYNEHKQENVQFILDQNNNLKDKIVKLLGDFLTSAFKIQDVSPLTQLATKTTLDENTENFSKILEKIYESNKNNLNLKEIVDKLNQDLDDDESIKLKNPLDFKSFDNIFLKMYHLKPENGSDLSIEDKLLQIIRFSVPNNDQFIGAVSNLNLVELWKEINKYNQGDFQEQVKEVTDFFDQLKPDMFFDGDEKNFQELETKLNWYYETFNKFKPNTKVSRELFWDITKQLLNIKTK